MGESGLRLAVSEDGSGKFSDIFTPWMNVSAGKLATL